MRWGGQPPAPHSALTRAETISPTPYDARVRMWMRGDGIVILDDVIGAAAGATAGAGAGVGVAALPLAGVRAATVANSAANRPTLVTSAATVSRRPRRNARRAYEPVIAQPP